MKLNEILDADVPRSTVRKKSKKPMGLSKTHNKHAKRQQNKAGRQYKINLDDNVKVSKSHTD